MKTTLALIKRNRKLFFRDKGMLISSLITPIILIVLYGTFLANIYRDSFLSALPDFFKISDKLVDGTAGGSTSGCKLCNSNLLCKPDYDTGSGQWCKKGF